MRHHGDKNLSGKKDEQMWWTDVHKNMETTSLYAHSSLHKKEL